ncbi:MAG: hypothetical protein SXV54_25710, partial [Chloroflexota bacterium]|nr:hypothetical protein [Chloroflexota bacterium]
MKVIGKIGPKSHRMAEKYDPGIMTNRLRCGKIVASPGGPVSITINHGRCVKKRELVYKVISAFLLAAMLISLGPMDLRMVRASDPPPPRGGIELTEAQRREIAQQAKDEGADDVFFPESRGDELVVGITKDGDTQYLVAWEEVVDGDQLSDDFPKVESPPPCPVPAIQAEQPFIGKEVIAGAQPCEEQAFAGIARPPSERPERVRVLEFAFLDEETFVEALAIPEEQSLSKRLPLSGLFGVKPAYAQETHYFWLGESISLKWVFTTEHAFRQRYCVD